MPAVVVDAKAIRLVQETAKTVVYTGYAFSFVAESVEERKKD